MTSEQVLELMVRSANDALHPQIHAWTTEAERQANLREELEGEVGWLDRREWWERFAENCPVSGAAPEDYRGRWLTILPDLHVLAGPGFLGGDLTKPLVRVMGTSRPLLAADLPALRAVLFAEFALFAPLFALFTHAAPIGHMPHTRPDRRVLAAPLQLLRGRELPASLTLRRAENLDFYPRYAAVYAALHEAHPEHRAYSRAEDQEDLQDALDAGMLFEVCVDGAWAGVVAGKNDVQFGMRGVTVAEALLDAPFKGRGLGAALSLALARGVERPGEQFLFGTIHAENTAAYRAALRAGRADVGGWVQLP